MSEREDLDTERRLGVLEPATQERPEGMEVRMEEAGEGGERATGG